MTIGNLPEVVSREQWWVARRELLAREKELTRLRDRLNADRRRLPMVRVEKEYRFEGRDGDAGLVDLFEGRSQLVMHHFRYGPDFERACPSCSSAADQIPRLRQLLGRQEEWEEPKGAPHRSGSRSAVPRCGCRTSTTAEPA
jgi:predicted dithiol-disulfide oxidoreductase (DUF899 family)